MSAATACAGLLASNRHLRQQLDSLAGQFDLELISKPPDEGYFLNLTDQGLQLQHTGARSPGPIMVDFAAGALAHRRRFGGGRGQPLARAVGMKPGFSPTIWDATAGLGRDSFVLASLGSRVTLCERSAILCALLQDGLQRAAADTEIGAWVAQRLQLVHGDSCTLLRRLGESGRPQVVYLDPMYPPGKEHVLVKKEMQALQRLAGPDRDSHELLEVALQTARRRVVVKRPKRAGWLHELKPDTAIESRKTRYDIYVTL